MPKTLEKYNSQQIYIRTKYKPLWKEFIKLANKDPVFLKERRKTSVGNPGVLSIAILILVYNYVKDKNPDFKLEK